MGWYLFPKLLWKSFNMLRKSYYFVIIFSVQICSCKRNCSTSFLYVCIYYNCFTEFGCTAIPKTRFSIYKRYLIYVVLRLTLTPGCLLVSWDKIATVVIISTKLAVHPPWSVLWLLKKRFWVIIKCILCHLLTNIKFYLDSILFSRNKSAVSGYSIPSILRSKVLYHFVNYVCIFGSHSSILAVALKHVF